jgi:AraC-like DNA-binding protein
MPRRQVAPNSAFSSDSSVTPATARLLRVAAELAAFPSPDVDDPLAQAALAEFLRLYSSWIISHRGMSDSLATWAEQSRILVHCMASAGTLKEAIKLNVRFATAFWGDQVQTEMRDENGGAALIFRESIEAGPDGLIRAMWPLIATLSQLEFLAGGPLPGISGRVRNSECLPQSTVALLFRGSLSYRATEAALLVPANLLRRAVVARAADIPAFFDGFMATTVSRSRGHSSASMRDPIEKLIRSDKLRRTGAPVDLPSVATRLGCSVATIRRRLRDEGTSFRKLKDDVFENLAKIWLQESDLSVEAIAERLGYSSSYAFRRSFHRRNRLSPLAYRRLNRAPD